MNIALQIAMPHDDAEIVATFGTARLVKNTNGRHELIGGTPGDQLAAIEWCSFFNHDIVFSRKPSQGVLNAFCA